METDLLWVYEGMNRYLGDLISFRSGIRDYKSYLQYLASIYAEMDAETGRDTTPLIDLTAGAPTIIKQAVSTTRYAEAPETSTTEGELLWIDADTIIRERSHGARSLDTSLQKFTAPESTGPITKTYNREDHGKPDSRSV